MCIRDRIKIAQIGSSDDLAVGQQVVAITTVSVQEIPSFFGYSSRQYKSASTGSGIIVGDMMMSF